MSFFAQTRTEHCQHKYTHTHTPSVRSIVLWTWYCEMLRIWWWWCRGCRGCNRMVMKHRTTKTNYGEVYATANASPRMCSCYVWVFSHSPLPLCLYLSLVKKNADVNHHVCTENIVLLLLLCSPVCTFFSSLWNANFCVHLFFTSKWAQNKYWSVLCACSECIFAYIYSSCISTVNSSTAESKHDQRKATHTKKNMKKQRTHGIQENKQQQQQSVR